MPDPQRITVGEMIDFVTLIDRTPQDWLAMPEIGQMVIRREKVLSASPGWRAFNDWKDVEHHRKTPLEAAKELLALLVERLRKPSEQLRLMPLLAAVRLLGQLDAAGPPDAPNASGTDVTKFTGEKSQPHSADLSGSVTPEAALIKVGIVGMNNPPPMELSFETAGGHRGVIRVVAGKLTFGEMTMLWRQLTALFGAMPTTPAQSAQALKNAIAHTIGLLQSAPGFQRFMEWSNVELGCVPCADAAEKLKARLSQELKIPFGKIEMMSVVDVMRLIDERKPAGIGATNVFPSGIVTPAAPAELPEAPPPRGEQEPAAASGDKAVQTPAARVLAAAYDLQREGKPISLRSACERAGVDRAHLRQKYPEAVRAILRMKTPDRTPRRGVRDRRTGDIDALDDPKN